MRKLLYSAIVVGALAIMAGCTTTNENEFLASPGTLTYQVTNDGFAVVLSWDTVSDADGYYVYMGDVAVDTIDEKDSTTIRVDEIGAYKVRAYKGDLLSDPTNTVDLRPKETPSTIIYDALHYSDPNHPSAAGWDEEGNLQVYALSDSSNCGYIDFYFKNDSLFGIQESQHSCTHVLDTTFFHQEPDSLRYVNVDSVTTEPNVGGITVTNNRVYTVKVRMASGEVHYAKIWVNTNPATYSISIRAAFQTIAGFKRVGNAAK